MRTLGVDVSHWEGQIDWQVAAPAIGFAYYKCTDGTRGVDDQLANNRRGCDDAGLPHAPYHYYQPSLDPTAQAEHFIEAAGKDYGKYILDVEQPTQDKQLSRKLQAFLERVEQLTGTLPAIYTSAGYWNETLQPAPAWAGKYDLIVAHYTSAHAPQLPAGWERYTLWQFSDFWNFPGCRETADANWFNGNLEQCRAWFGNAHAPVPTPASSGKIRMRSQFDHLRIRLVPSAQGRVTGYLDKGDVIAVEDVSGNDVWVRHAQGWSAFERGGYRFLEVIK